MDDEQIVDKPVTDEDLRDLKYGKEGVETTKAEDEPSEPEEPATPPEETEAEESDQITPEEESEQSETFTKQFPNIKGDTPEEYAKNLETAYEHSTAEFQKLRQQPAPVPTSEESEDVTQPTWTELYAQQKLQEEADSAYTDLTKSYPQAVDQQSPSYQQFVKEVDTLSRTILASQGRLAPPAELYSKAAVILGWEKSSEPTENEKLGMAVKDGAAVSKSNSISRVAPKSKVTDQDITLFRKLNPTSELKDSEIRKELEPHK